MNGYTSEQRELPQSRSATELTAVPVLFLFFNADLVQDKINAGGGSVGFMDDYTAW